MRKPFIVANFRDIYDAIANEEITFSKGVELLNDIAFTFYNENYTIKTNLSIADPNLQRLGINEEENFCPCTLFIKNIELARPAINATTGKEEGTIFHAVSGERYITDLPFKNLR